MKILRLYAVAGSPIFQDSRPSIDGAADKSTFEAVQYGVIIRRKDKGVIFVPYTNIAYCIIDDEPVPTTVGNLATNPQGKRA